MCPTVPTVPHSGPPTRVSQVLRGDYLEAFCFFVRFLHSPYDGNVSRRSDIDVGNGTRMMNGPGWK